MNFGMMRQSLYYHEKISRDVIQKGKSATKTVI